MSFFSGRRQTDPEPPPRQPEPTPARQPVGFETVLGESTALRGDLRSQANVRLDGNFEGTLEIDGNVLIGEAAQITADVNARNISIAGSVRGNVNGVKVQLLRTGRVWGDITAQSITTEDGAFIDGRITMQGHEAEAASSALPGGQPQSLPAGVAASDATIPDFLEPLEDDTAHEGQIIAEEDDDTPPETPPAT